MVYQVLISILLVNQNGIIVYANEQIKPLFGYSQDELIGGTVDCLMPLQFRKNHSQQVKRYLHASSEQPMSGGRVLPGLTKDGKKVNMEIGLNPIILEGEKYVIVSLLNTRNQILKISAFNDELTGLPNRALFNELSENLRHLAIRNQTSITIAFIDLDGFKAVNDNLGHDVGDHTLYRVADIIRNSIRKNDVAARIGGDEFLICYYDILYKADADKVTRNILKEIETIKLEGHNINIGASIGMIFTQNPAKTNIEEMTKMADTLMYQVKRSGKNRVFSNEL